MNNKKYLILGSCLILIATSILFYTRTSTDVQNAPAQEEQSYTTNNEQYVDSVWIMHADWPFYHDIEALTNSSTDIVRATAMSSRVEEFNASLDATPAYQISTITTFRVLEVFDGNMEIGDYFDLVQPGGIVGSTQLINYDAIELGFSDDFVLFLNTHFMNQGVYAFLLNPFQAVYNIPSSVESITNLDLTELEIELASAFEFSSPEEAATFNLEITLEDLVDIAEGELSSERSRQRRARRRR